MTQKQLFETIEDLADDNGKSVDEFVLELIKTKNDEKLKRFSLFPDDAAKEVMSAEKLRQDSRREKREKKEKDDFKNQIENFLGLFPDVAPEQIPEKVWIDVANGIPLVYAYAYSISTASDADKINAENEFRTIPVRADKSGDILYSEADVEKMSPNGIKANFNKVLKSMKNWK